MSSLVATAKHHRVSPEGHPARLTEAVLVNKTGQEEDMTKLHGGLWQC